MNKAELVDALAEHFGGNRAEATRALNAVLQTIIYKTATEGRVTILGFGTFEKTVRPARSVQDPSTGRKIRIKALATPAFRAGAEFKAYVAGVKKVPRVRRKPPSRLVSAAQEQATSDADTGGTPSKQAPPKLDSEAATPATPTRSVRSRRRPTTSADRTATPTK